MKVLSSGMAMSLLLGLIYTHHTSIYGNLFEKAVTVSFQPNLSGHELSRSQFQSAGAIEGLFRWGAGEIPREQLYPALCGPDFIAMEILCAVCNSP